MHSFQQELLAFTEDPQQGFRGFQGPSDAAMANVGSFPTQGSIRPKGPPAFEVPQQSIRPKGPTAFAAFSGSPGLSALRSYNSEQPHQGRCLGDKDSWIAQGYKGTMPISPVQHSVDLLDLDPVPVIAPQGRHSDPKGSVGWGILDPQATHATPFTMVQTALPPPPRPIEDKPAESESVTPRTPRVGTNLASAYTPGGTRVPDGPPPSTPPPLAPCVSSNPTSPQRTVTFGNVTTTPLPASPIPGPPAPPAGGMGWPGSSVPPLPTFTGVDASSSSASGLRSEEPSRMVHSLPGLQVGDNSAEASVVTGDWLARIGPIMRSLSQSAPQWWGHVTSKAQGFYSRWLHADPLQRLSLKAEAVGYAEDFAHLARVEERGSVLILQAIPVELQTEAVSVRALSTTSLLFLIMSRYQPGGSNEKAMILAYLTQPSVEGQISVGSNHAALRKWERLFRRCKELGLQAPDPTLLVRALDSLGKVIVNKSSHAAFRLSSFRHSYQLDVQPTEETVLHYCQLLTAELETLSLMQVESNKHQRVAALQVPNPSVHNAIPPAPKDPKAPNPRTHHPRHRTLRHPILRLPRRGSLRQGELGQQDRWMIRGYASSLARHRGVDMVERVCTRMRPCRLRMADVSIAGPLDIP